MHLNFDNKFRHSNIILNNMLICGKISIYHYDTFKFNQ